MWGDHDREEGTRAGEMEGSPSVLKRNVNDWCGDLTDSILPESKCNTKVKDRNRARQSMFYKKTSTYDGNFVRDKTLNLPS